MPRRRRGELPPEGGGFFRVHNEPLVVADPDTIRINRGRALFHNLGLELQGYAGTRVDYDRGDPVHTLTGPVPVHHDPSESLAAIGRSIPESRIPTANFTDQGISDGSYLSSYEDALWYRGGR